MKEVQPSVLCGVCGSTMNFLCHNRNKDWSIRCTIFKCPDCKSEVVIYKDRNEDICPYCFSGCYHISGIDEGSSMCSNPSCSGFTFEFVDKHLDIRWNGDLCFSYYAEIDWLTGWTSPLHHNIKDFYKRIIKHHKFPAYYLGWRGLYSLTYKLWKYKHPELLDRG